MQYESEIQTAIVNLRTAKIQLLQLLNERTPVDQFDVTGPFDFSDSLKPLDDFHQIALDQRPDLQAAIQTIQQSKTNHKLAVSNGSTDPTFSAWWTYNSSINNTGVDDKRSALSVNIPLRIFDRNQGEKKRTLIDIDRSHQTNGCHAGTGLQRRGHGLRSRCRATSRCSSPTRRNTMTRPRGCATPSPMPTSMAALR